MAATFSATAHAQSAGAESAGALSRPYRGDVSEVPRTDTSPPSEAPASEAPEAEIDLTTVPIPPVQRGGDGTAFEGATVSASDAACLRALESDLQVLAVRGGGSIVDAVLSMLSGGISIAVGALINDAISPYLYLYGGGNAVRGGLSLLFLTDPSGLSVAYSHMPMRTAEEMAARLAFGERALESLSSTNQLGRIVDGSLNIGVGLAIIPVYLAPNNFELSNPFDYFVLVASGISIIGGVFSLVSPSEAERRWSAYQELRQRVRGRPRSDSQREQLTSLERSLAESTGVRVAPTIAPLQGGFAVGLNGSF